MSHCYQSESIFKLPDTKWILLLSEKIASDSMVEKITWRAHIFQSIQILVFWVQLELYISQCCTSHRWQEIYTNRHTLQERHEVSRQQHSFQNTNTKLIYATKASEKKQQHAKPVRTTFDWLGAICVVGTWCRNWSRCGYRWFDLTRTGWVNGRQRCSSKTTYINNLQKNIQKNRFWFPLTKNRIIYISYLQHNYVIIFCILHNCLPLLCIRNQWCLYLIISYISQV